MAKKQKLFQKLLNNPKNIGFSEFVNLLEAFGFELKRVSGSHHIFKHPSAQELLSIQPGKDGQAKPYQINQFLKLVEAYNLRLDGGNEE
jgi:predicted RNA binding protein YcfA (HicA-like mRNA interferase family)